MEPFDYNLFTNKLRNYLQELKLDELKMLINDNEKLDLFLKKINTTELNKYNSNKEFIIACQISLAEYNISNEKYLNDSKNNIKELIENEQLLIESIKSKQEILKNKNNNLNNVLSQLKIMLKEIEDLSDDSLNKFFEGKVNVDKFIDLYVEQRKLMHLRKIKTDKLIEMISRRSNSLPSSRIL